MILVSGCLSGNNPCYDDKVRGIKKFKDLVKNGLAIAVCPEILGGLKVPRDASEIKGGTGHDVLLGKCKVATINGKDVTINFIKGAREVLKIAKARKIKKAVFKSNSPACGCGRIYDGSFSGKLIAGDGVAAAILKMNGIKVVNAAGRRFKKC